MKKSILWLKLIGAILLIVLLRKVDISLIVSRIRSGNLYFLCAAVFFQVIVIFIRVMRWRYILKILKVRVCFYNALKAFWSGLYLAAITPGKLGEISRAYFIVEDSPSIARPMLSVFIDRLADAISLLLFGILASYFYLNELGQLNKLLIFLLVGSGLSIVLIFLKRNMFYIFFRKIAHKFVSKEKIPLRENLDFHFLEGWKINNCILLFSFILLGWLVFFFGWWLLAKALYIKISFLKIMLTISIATIVSILPISIGGLGTRDAAVVFIFSKMGIMKDAALSFSLLIFAVEIATVCGGVLFLLHGFNLGGLKDNVKVNN